MSAVSTWAVCTLYNDLDFANNEHCISSVQYYNIMCSVFYLLSFSSFSFRLYTLKCLIQQSVILLSFDHLTLCSESILNIQQFR